MPASRLDERLPKISLENMLHRLLLASGLLLALPPVQAESQEAEPVHVFSGGMIFHAGFARAENTYGEIGGVITGLGGRLHLETLPFVRFGLTGGASSVTYDEHGSYLSMSYWGPLIELSRRFGLVKPSVGLFVGRGSVDNLHIIEQNPDQTQTADFRQSSTFTYAPVLTLEVFLTERFALTLMLDHLSGDSIEASSHYGPRGFLGLLFYR